MTTPTREQVIEKAIEMFARDRCKNADPSFDILPTEQELSENGYIASARSELMYGTDRKWSSVSELDSIKKTEVLSGPESVNFTELAKSETFINALLKGGCVIFGASGTGKSTLAKFLVRVLSSKGINCYIVDPSLQYLNLGFNVIQVSTNQEEYEMKTQTTVFDVCMLGQNEKLTFVNALCGSLLTRHIEEPSSNEILVLEESELYLQNNVLRSKKAENIMSLISMGRNFNLRYITIGQAPALIDKVFLKLCELKFYGFLSEVNDLNCLKRSIGKTWAEAATKLNTGEFLLQSRGMTQKVKVELEKPRTSYGLNYTLTNGRITELKDALLYGIRILSLRFLRFGLC